MGALTQVFFDTGVLVAAAESSHSHHAQALPALRRAAKGDGQGFIGVHSIAETYAALMRLPVQPRIHPSEAGRIIRDNILKHCTLVPAGQAEYLQPRTAVQDSGSLVQRGISLALCARAGLSHQPARLYGPPRSSARW